ncbi:sulfatase [Aestuariivivens sp. NBU2969]|uniref:sulfatase family protein n=1 Tax=Aestuariivivens sp. NBU2969 TaxID=2873267 RepID=UPI001CBC15E6|nr:sulfatase-like hydrolase/transferase [Aestuariivivens sp. NBU2969]
MKFISLALCFLFLSCLSDKKNKHADISLEKPNILLIITDDQGYADYAAYGGANDVSTPAMDIIANSGVLFTNAYATSPICNASRAGIITGNYQQRWGTFYYGGNVFPETVKTIPELLKKEGYRTIKIGKTHYAEILDNNNIENPTKLREFPLNHGYDEFLGFCAHRHDYFKMKQSDDVIEEPYDDRMSQRGPLWVNNDRKDFDGYATNVFGDEAVKQIYREDERPFFMELAFNAVHHPIYQAPEEYLQKFGIEKFPEWDPKLESFKVYHERNCWMGEIDPDGRKRYLANLACLDDNIAKVLAALKQTEKWENTLIIFVSDNGGSQNTYANNGILKGHKYILTEGGIRTAFTMSWPKKLKSNQKFNTPVSHLDILPTILSAVGSKVQDSITTDGKNIFQVIEKQKQTIHENLVWDTGNEWAVRSGSWKLHVAKTDYIFRSIHLEKGTYLYNLLDDPGCKNNLADKNPVKVTELTKIHENWVKNL